MGTRSTVTFHSEWNQEPIVTIYQQYDGYISGVGHELADFLKDVKVVNGYNSGQSAPECANGMGCLAAQYIARHKTEIGGFYITKIGDSQEYDYFVRLENGKLTIQVDDFYGTPDELLKYEESVSWQKTKS